MTTNKKLNTKETRKTILIDGITTGKMENGIFSFTYRKKLIDQRPFDLKGPNQNYGYRHHLEMTDIEELGKTFPELFTYGQTKEKTGKNWTLETWGKTMTSRLSKIISEGGFNRTLTDDKGTTHITLQWTGELIDGPTEEKELPTKKEKELQEQE